MTTDTNPLPGLPVSKEEAARISRGSFEKAVGERTKLAKLEAAKAQADARAMLSGRDAEALRMRSRASSSRAQSASHTRTSTSLSRRPTNEQ